MAITQVDKMSRSRICKIAKEYANSELDYSAHYFAEQYALTESVFYSVLKRAVVESIVDMETVNKISKKAAANSAEHGGEGGKTRSEKKYKHYLFLRERFNFKIADKVAYTEGYAESCKNVSEYCIEKNIADRKLLERTIASAIVDNLVKDDVVEKLKAKAINFHGERAEKYFELLIAERNKKIAEKKDLERRKREKKKKKES